MARYEARVAEPWQCLQLAQCQACMDSALVVWCWLDAENVPFASPPPRIPDTISPSAQLLGQVNMFWTHRETIWSPYQIKGVCAT